MTVLWVDAWYVLEGGKLQSPCRVALAHIVHWSQGTEGDTSRGFTRYLDVVRIDAIERKFYWKGTVEEFTTIMNDFWHRSAG